MRTVLAGIAIVALFSTAAFAADEKIDAKKLLGKWEPKSDTKSKTVIDFMADGKLSVTGDAAISGTWKLDGSKLTLMFAVGENEMKDTVTITKLTDEELAVEDAKKEKKQSFKRVK